MSSMQEDETLSDDSHLQPAGPNVQISSFIWRVHHAKVSGVESHMPVDKQRSRTELDSHASMCVLGKNCCILQRSGRHAQVSPFSPDLDDLQRVPIVDACIAYDDPYSGKAFLLVVYNALHLPSMDHNLIPPFILREAGIEINEVPKIHAPSPSVTNHSVYIPSAGLRMPLLLWGIFSYFPTRCPTREELIDPDSEIYDLTPCSSNWNPHSQHYAENEENMMDWEGQMVLKPNKVRVMIDDLPDAADLFSVAVCAAEATVIDSLLDRAPCLNEPLSDVSYDDLLPALVVAPCPLEAINLVLDPLAFAAALDARATIRSFSVSIGATNAVDDVFCLEKDVDGPLLDNEMDISMLNPDLLDEIFTSSATSASHVKGVTAEHLSKIWKIDKDTANRTIDVTTQRVRRSDDPSLARNFSTNDRMLRYRRLKEHFYMDTFFATKKAGVSSHGNSCMQLFVYL